jgi:multidrug efflux pump subunit AcrA (membrane-fusion protein)
MRLLPLVPGGAKDTVKKLFAVFVAIGLVAGAGVYYRSAHPRTPHYPTAHIEYGPIAEVIRGTGMVEVRNATVVSSPILGEVVEIAPEADFGRTVTKGQKLLQLDDAPATLKRDQANTLVELATKERDAAQAVAAGAARIVEQMNQAKSSFGQVERNKAEAELQAAQDRVKAVEAKIEEAKVGVRAAEYAISRNRIESPVDGVIIDRKVVRGQGVGPQLTTPLFIIAPNMAEMRVLAQIAQTDIGKVLEGQKATVSLFTSGEKQAERISHVKETRLAPTQLPGGIQSPGTVLYSAVIDVPNVRIPNKSGAEAWELRHGMTADVTIYLRPESIAWKVPKDAIELDLDAVHIPPRAKARLEQWSQQKHAPDEWKRIWVLDNNEPWPVFIRVRDGNGEKGIEDDHHLQFFDWDWGENDKRARAATNA